MSDEKDYTLLEDDLFSPGSRIKLDHVLYLNEYDISELLDKSVEEVRELYNESFKKEESMYEVLQGSLRKRNRRRPESAARRCRWIYSGSLPL